MCSKVAMCFTLCLKQAYNGIFVQLCSHVSFIFCSVVRLCRHVSFITVQLSYCVVMSAPSFV